MAEIFGQQEFVEGQSLVNYNGLVLFSKIPNGCSSLFTLVTSYFPMQTKDKSNLFTLIKSGFTYIKNKLNVKELEQNNRQEMLFHHLFLLE